MKVKFENPTGNKFAANFPGTRFTIPAHAVGKKAFIKELPDLPRPALKKWIEDLKSRYRALRISPVEDELDDLEVSGDSTGGGLPPVDDLTGKPEGPDEELDLFKADVLSVKSSGSGWWAVEVKNSETPIKVRATTEEDAIKEAFKSYMEG